MIRSIKLFLKGFVIGISNLIPGLSGGTVALVLGIYEDFLYALGHLLKEFKKNFAFLLPVLLGMAASLISLSGIISYCLTNFLFITILFFCGAICGGIPPIYNTLKGCKLNFSNILCFSMAFLAVTIPLFIKGREPVLSESITLPLFITLTVLGMIASATMIIPGISGSAVLMAIGYYHFIIDALHGLSSPQTFSQSIIKVIPYAIGLALGLILSSRLIEECLKRYKEKSYFAIMGFIISSILVILIQNDIFKTLGELNIAEILFGVLLFILGCVSALKLGD